MWSRTAGSGTAEPAHRIDPLGMVKHVKAGAFRFELGAPLAAEDPAHYWDRLGELAALLRGLPWALAGGLAVAVTAGRFYRRHDDADIVFPVDALRDVEAAMARGGFTLHTHFPWSLFGAVGGAVHVRMSAADALARNRTRKLKFRDFSGRRAPPFSIVEAFPYRLEGGALVTCDGRHRLVLDRPVVGHRHTADNGCEIPCFDLHYVALCKRGKHEPKHAVDLAVIAEQRPAPLPVPA